MAETRHSASIDASLSATTGPSLDNLHGLLFDVCKRSLPAMTVERIITIAEERGRELAANMAEVCPALGGVVAEDTTGYMGNPQTQAHLLWMLGSLSGQIASLSSLASDARYELIRRAEAVSAQGAKRGAGVSPVGGDHGQR